MPKKIKSKTAKIIKSDKQIKPVKLNVQNTSKIGEIDKPDEVKTRHHYFNNALVEGLLEKYVKGGCVDVKLRDEIMSHSLELLRQIIRTHNLHNIYPGHDAASFGDLMQVGYVQIERTLYKFDWKPGHTKVFNFWCVSPDTMLITNKGIERMGNILESAIESREFGQAYGIGGLHDVEAAKLKLPQNVLEITTALGYNIKCTPEHKLQRLTSNGHNWVEVKDLKIGDLVGLQYNQQHFVNNDDLTDIVLSSDARHEWQPPARMTEDLAYIIGLFIAEGSFGHNMVNIYNEGVQVRNSVINNKSKLKFTYYETNGNLCVCSKRFKEFLIALGFPETLTAQTKFIPSRLLKCSQPILRALLRGLFDGDGHSSRHNGVVGFSSSSKLLFDQVRMLLLNFGILSSMYVDDRVGYSSKTVRRGESVTITRRSVGYELYCPTYDSAMFYRSIGFNEERKNIKSLSLIKSKERIYGISDHMYRLARACKLNGKLQYDRGDQFNILSRVLRDIQLITEKIDHHNNDFKFVQERLDERTRSCDNLIWLPVTKIDNQVSVVCEIGVNSDDHSYIANGFVSHNSQVAKTVILAHIKREMRDKKNYGTYKGHLSGRHRSDGAAFERFIKEAKEMSKYDDSGQTIIDCLEKLYEKDEKPYDGLIGKLVKLSGLSRQRVTSFLRQVRLRSFEFTDSPLNQERNQIYKGSRKEFDADEEDENY